MSDLAVGDEAWCLLFHTVGTASRSGDREHLRGAARVRIEAVDGDIYKVVTLLASGGVPGEHVEFGRLSLYATHGEEHRAFGELVRWYWPPRGGWDAHRPQTPSPPRHPLLTRTAADVDDHEEA